MKLTTGILLITLMAGGSAMAQSPDAIDNARNVVKSLNQQANAPASTKPAPGAPAPAIKPAVIPGASVAKAPVVAKAVGQPAASGDNNQLKHVSVVPGSNDIQIEISSSETVTPRVSKLSAPDRVLVELPETAVGTAQNKIPVGSGGVKGIRIGMDGKTPPTTSVVVDLEKPLPFELAPGSAGKVVLIVHTQDSGSTIAKSVSAPAAKPAVAAPVKAVAVATAAAPKVVDAKAPKAVAAPVAVAKVVDAKGSTQAKVVDAKVAAVAPKVVDAKASATQAATTKTVAAPAPAAKVADAKAPAAKTATAPVKADAKQPAKNTVVAAKPAPAVAASAPEKTVEAAKAPKPEEKHWAMNGKRDPFFSPVVQQNGSGCSTGKKCLEINAINLRGVVKSDTGFIAVVTNNLNKAYFLRENDPVFNGYVVKITGDSVTFSETVQDKLGKPFTREVVKRIFTPAV